jgi:hypothetical protein
LCFRGEPRTLWGAFGKQTAVLRIAPDHGKQHLHGMTGNEFGGIVAPIASALTEPERRQVCWSHLRRDFTFHADLGLGSQEAFGHDGLEVTWNVFHAWKQFQQDGDIKRQMRPLLEWGSTGKRQRRVRALAKNLLKLWPGRWTFADMRDVEPTTNAAEPGLRAAVIYRKLSLGGRSQGGERIIEPPPPRPAAILCHSRLSASGREPSFAATFLAGLVADGLDVVAVGIEDVAAVVVGVVPAQARCAVVGAACLDGCGVEGVHVRAALGLQRDVKPPLHRLPVGFDEERRSSSINLAEPSGRSGELHQERKSKRRERLFVERLASFVVSNGEPDVIDHHHLLSAVVSYLLLHQLLPGVVRPLRRTAFTVAQAMFRRRPRRRLLQTVERIIGVLDATAP